MSNFHPKEVLTVRPTESIAIEELVAKQEIADVLYSYARGLDRMDRALADRVWHADGTADYGPGFRGTGTQFLDFVWTYHLTLNAHSHLVSNTLISVDLGASSATSEAYVSVWLRSTPSGGTVTDIHHRGRYVDRWSRRDGRWAIDHRIYLADMMNETTNAEGPETWGLRNADDPSYLVL
ncbi:hypothetical protein CH292_21100 [Rhodococcus sp. 14-2470-1a]|nr:hypothetical protein CH292_21100 [Rhodococcus sp. 14-2470-1a]